MNRNYRKIIEELHHKRKMHDSIVESLVSTSANTTQSNFYQPKENIKTINKEI